MISYKLTEKAGADFARLYEYGLDTFGYEQAGQYADYMEKCFSEITTNPLLYPATDESFLVAAAAYAMNTSILSGY